MNKIDRRTFTIVAIIVVIALPIIILAFHKSFFPIIASIRHTFTSAALTNSNTGIPVQLLPESLRKVITGK